MISDIEVEEAAYIIYEVLSKNAKFGQYIQSFSVFKRERPVEYKQFLDASRAILVVARLDQRILPGALIDLKL